MMKMRWLLPTLLLGPLTACTDDAEPVVEAGPVAALIQEHCAACHTEGGIAPYPFDTHEQTAALADLIAVAVSERTMPPINVNDDGSCHTFQDGRGLRDEEIATIVDWVNAGAPEQGWPERVPPERLDIEANVHLETPPYEVSGDGDDYRCFVVELDFEETQYLTAFDLIPGEPEVVHHMVAFHPNNDFAAEHARGLDASEDGEGYTCFGSSGTDSSIVAVWAPGFPPTEFPANTGIPIVGTRPVIIQMHYYAGLEPKTDSSQIAFTMAEAVEHPARIAAHGDTSIALAPGRESIDTATSFRVSGLPTNTVHAVLPHMHKRGQAMRLDVVNDEGRSCMTDMPRWDFDWQRGYFYDTPLLVDTTEMLELRCNFDTERDMDTVFYGDGSQDEMCFAFLYETVGAYEGAVPVADQVETAAHTPAAPLGSPPDASWSKRRGEADWDSLRALARGPGGSITGAGWLGESQNISDAFLVRFDADGVEQWAIEPGGDGSDWLNGVAPGPDGGVYVSGATDSAVLNIEGVDLSSNGGQDAMVLSFDADGGLRWAQRFGSLGADGGRRLAAHPQGGVVSLSWHDDTFEIGGSEFGVDGTRHAAIAHWNDDGTLAWVDTLATPGGFLNEVVVTPEGSVHAVGEIRAEGGELMGLRYTRSADGTQSDFKTYASESWGWFNALALDAEGNVYIAANSRGSASYMSSASFASGVDTVVLRIDAAGAETVIASFSGPGETRGRSLSITDDGEIIFAGSFVGELHHEGQVWPAHGGEDVFVAKLSSEGTTWLRTFGNHDRDTYPIVLAEGDRTWLTFESRAAIRIGEETHEGYGERDLVLVALD